MPVVITVRDTDTEVMHREASSVLPDALANADFVEGKVLHRHWTRNGLRGVNGAGRLGGPIPRIPAAPH